MLDILYQDDQLLIVNKPAGLLSVRGRGPDKIDSIQHRAESLFPQALIVHRLDCATSGLMVLAKTKAAHAALSQQFRERLVEKEYHAVTFGHCPRPSGVIELPLITDWPNRPKQKVCFENGKPAVTHYQCLTQHGEKNRLLLQPITGRSHQLRVHTMALGMAIIGDNLYAEPPVAAMSSRLLLHAHKIRFQHPTTGKAVALEAPLPF